MAAALARAGHQVLVSTATDTPLYLEPHPAVRRRAGRLDHAGLGALVREHAIRAIVSATHPFAAAARRAARSVAAEAGIPMFTFMRPSRLRGDEEVIFVGSHEEAARVAFEPGRPVLLTTGSRNLEPYARAARLRPARLVARVLAHPDSTAACAAVGLGGDAVVSGRGPFSVEENRALLEKFEIGTLVTKDSGEPGG
ncbi:MAG: precorrin-6A reductase, partial [Myxococcaceae bacterium]